MSFYYSPMAAEAHLTQIVLELVGEQLVSSGELETVGIESHHFEIVTRWGLETGLRTVAQHILNAGRVIKSTLRVYMDRATHKYYLYAQTIPYPPQPGGNRITTVDSGIMYNS